MMPITTLALYALGTILILSFWRALNTATNALRSPLRHLPGPPSKSWLWGHLQDIFSSEPLIPQERWVEQYGPTLAYAGLFSQIRLFTLDTRALGHILTHTNIYQKPIQMRRGLGRILGQGLVVTEDEVHRRQRKAMNPAFGPAQLRDLTPIFLEKGAELRDAWMMQVQNNPDTATEVDAFSWLTRTTLDIIGIAGFNYDFGSLKADETTNELYQAFSEMMNANSKMAVVPLLQDMFPFLHRIPSRRDRTVEVAQGTMRRIGLQLISERKAAVLQLAGDSIDKRSVEERDILSLLVRANMAADLPANQRLSDEEVLAQIPTFLVAGHETTSASTIWALFALTQRSDVQSRLREELLSVPTESPTMDDLQALSFLDAVVRETLRLHAPIPSTVRNAERDDVIPLSALYLDRRGVKHESIRIGKGDPVSIPIVAINRAKSIWGEDALEFRPERWEQPLPEAATAIPGLWSDLLTFIGGSHACIGYRFSIVEMKALLFVLVRAFEFELAVPVEHVEKKATVVTRPLVRGKEGNQLPLNIRRYVA